MMAASEREFVGYGKDYPRISWPDDAQIAINLVVNFEEGSERTPLYGDPLGEPTSEGFSRVREVRDLRHESHFDYGTRRAFWRLMEIFDRYDVKISFNACAMALERNPVLAREITALGHEPFSHGYRWIPSYSLTREEEREHIRKAV